MMVGIVATSYSAGDKFYIDPAKLLPLSRFLPQPKYVLFRINLDVIARSWLTDFFMLLSIAFDSQLPKQVLFRHC